MAVPDVPGKDLPDDLGFPLVDRQVKIIPFRFVITIHEIGDPSSFCIFSFAKFYALAYIRALLLCQRTEHGEHKFRLPEHGHVRRQEQCFNAESFERPHVLQQIYRVPGKTADVFYD